MVENVSYLLNIAVQGMFIFLFLYRIFGKKFKTEEDLIKMLAAAFVFTAFMLFTLDWITEPIRSILVMLILSVYFKFSMKIKFSHSFFVVFISKMICSGVFFVAVFMGYNFNYFILKNMDEIFFIQDTATLIFLTGLNIIVYCTVLKINVSFVFRRDEGFEKPLTSALIMMLFSYGSISFLLKDEVFLLGLFLWAMFITGTIFLIHICGRP